MEITLNQTDCLKAMKELPDNSIDMIFTDPPYALGSQIIIRADGKPDYKKAKDFMNKWEMPNAKFWEEWFFEAKRVLKYGGHCAMFGIDRQTFLFQYYAVLNGFLPKQSLYWYFISNFPKASDLSKNIDKRFGLERESIPNPKARQQTGSNEPTLSLNAKKSVEEIQPYGVHPLAQKYKDLKYSVAPLKQTCEEIMVFQKPYKNKSCLDDVLAYENGDESITIGALDIENNRVGVEEVQGGGGELGKQTYGKLSRNLDSLVTNIGRYPAQTFVDSGTAERLDLQSGIRSETKPRILNCKAKDNYFGTTTKGPRQSFKMNAAGGCSKILHKCDYEEKDFDLFIYNPKVAKSERSEGNSHPTIKPIKLLSYILKLFKTPNTQTILDPFMGSGSMGISAVNCDYNFIGYELNSDYFQIAQNRIENAKNKIEECLI